MSADSEEIERIDRLFKSNSTFGRLARLRVIVAIVGWLAVLACVAAVFGFPFQLAMLLVALWGIGRAGLYVAIGI